MANRCRASCTAPTADRGYGPRRFGFIQRNMATPPLLRSSPLGNPNGTNTTVSITVAGGGSIGPSVNHKTSGGVLQRQETGPYQARPQNEYPATRLPGRRWPFTEGPMSTCPSRARHRGLCYTLPKRCQCPIYENQRLNSIDRLLASSGMDSREERRCKSRADCARSHTRLWPYNHNHRTLKNTRGPRLAQKMLACMRGDVERIGGSRQQRERRHENRHHPR